MKLLMLVVFWMIHLVVGAQSAGTLLLAGADGLGRKEGSIWGRSAYPGGLMATAPPAMGFFGEKRYLTDLTMLEFAYRGKMGELPFVVNAGRVGNVSLSANSMAFSAGKALHERLGVGIRMGYRNQLAAGYLPSHSFSVGMGALFTCSDRVRVGLQADGINNFFSKEFRGGYKVRAGLGYQASDFLLVTAEVLREPFFPAAIFLATQYKFLDQAWARVGYYTQLNSFLCSAGFVVGGFESEFFSTYHLALGLSAGVSVVYRFRRLP